MFWYCDAWIFIRITIHVCIIHIFIMCFGCPLAPIYVLNPIHWWNIELYFEFWKSTNLSEYILSLVRYKVHLRTFYFILFIIYFTTIFLTHFYFLFFSFSSYFYPFRWDETKKIWWLMRIHSLYSWTLIPQPCGKAQAHWFYCTFVIFLILALLGAMVIILFLVCQSGQLLR